MRIALILSIFCSLQHVYPISGLRLLNPAQLSKTIAYPENIDQLESMLIENVIGELVGYKVPSVSGNDGRNEKRLVTFESSLPSTREGDVVWGMVFNHLEKVDFEKLKQLELRSVIGPKTREFLQANGVDCPEVYCHPGTLFSRFCSYIHRRPHTTFYEILVGENLQQMKGRFANTVRMNQHWMVILQQIVSTKLFVTDSLCLAAIAESYGVPVRICVKRGADTRNFQDYYAITNRANAKVAYSVKSALKMRGVRLNSFNVSENQESFLDSFPYDYYKNY